MSVLLNSSTKKIITKREVYMNKAIFLILFLSEMLLFAQCPNFDDIVEDKTHYTGGRRDEFGIFSFADFSISINGQNFDSYINTSSSYNVPACSSLGAFQYIAYDSDGQNWPISYNVAAQTWHEVITSSSSNTWKFWVRPPNSTEVSIPDFVLNLDGTVHDAAFSSVPNQDLVRYPNNPKRLGYSIGTYGGSGSAARTAYTADCYCNEMGYQNGASSYQASSTSGTVMYKESGDWTITGFPSIHVITHITCDGSQVYKKNVEDSESISQNYFLEQNYPNPFNPTTEISFYIHKNSFVTLKVYDVLGKEISTLANRIYTEGSHTVAFDATELPSGVYFYTLTAGNFSDTKKMILTK